jgi:hypothetical protein
LLSGSQAANKYIAANVYSAEAPALTNVRTVLQKNKLMFFIRIEI